MAYRQEKISELLKQQAAAFVTTISSRAFLVTITQAKVSRDSQYVTFFISVYPDEKTEEALDFMRRKIVELRKYLKQHTRLNRIPHIDIEIDEGEKKRQRIDELSRDV